MRQLPQEDRDILVIVSILSMMSLQSFNKITQHLWTRLVTSFVVMGSLLLLLLLTLSLEFKKSGFVLWSSGGPFSVSTGPALASLLDSRHLFDTISVRSVILVRAWSCGGDFSLLIIII